MRIRGLIRSKVVPEITAEGADVPGARALIEEQLPEGYELIQVHNSMARGDHVIVVGQIRLAATSELEATGTDYRTASEAMLAKIPEDHRLLHVITIEG
jgi:hypothetical protein